MRGSAWLVLILASGSVVLAAVPPNHAPNHRSSPRFRPSPRDQQPTPLPKSTTPYDLSPSDETPVKKVSSAVTRLRQLLHSPKVVDRVPEATQVHEEKVEAANGPAHGQLLPLVHVLPQVTILLELLLHLLHQVVPPSPHLLHHYHHSGAPLYPHGVHHHAAHHHGGQHYHGAYQGGLLHPKPIGPFYGPGLYGVGSGNNVLGKGPFPAYKYEDNAKK